MVIKRDLICSEHGYDQARKRFESDLNWRVFLLLKVFQDLGATTRKRLGQWIGLINRVSTRCVKEATKSEVLPSLWPVLNLFFGCGALSGE